MDPQNWQKINELFFTARDLEPGAREVFLSESCSGNEELRKEVESLVAAHLRANSFIAASAFADGARLLAAEDANSCVGRAVGPYKLVRQIGSGGMGAVYLAERDDDQYHKKVAIKLVRIGLDADTMVRRFRSERQILALLEHPHVARLLDGGVTADGQPYIVMEYIEGARITDYCRTQELNISQRLLLFRQICSAVHYAHQHLVVHRDIKPSNILVSKDGAPKLLDFGIARILDSSASGLEGLTLTNLNPMTPEYASPEQIQGKGLTTATDIYSLGVLLYELLTGQKPYKTSDKTPQEVARLVCESEPQKPSTATTTAAIPSAAARLEAISGDLDHVVLKAMRKEPSQRYASAEELSGDVGNYLAGLPVRAREGSFRYLVGKFVARHKAVVALSSALLLALIVGLVLVSWEVHVAGVERARAQRRFNDVRRLANSFLFEFHDSIKDLPGATPARKLVVGRALEYLDGLSKEAGNDTSLQRELAAAYQKVGDVQGDPYSANLGDTPGALMSYRKALAIRESLLSADPDNKALKLELSGTYWKIGLSLDGATDFSGALINLRKALALTEQSWKVGDPRLSDQLAGDYRGIANVLAEIGDWREAVENHRKSASIREAAEGSDHEMDITLRTHLAADYYGIAEALPHLGQNSAAVEAARKSVSILQVMTQQDRPNATLRQYLADCQVLLGKRLEDQGLFDESLQSYRQALNIYQAAMAADPADARSHRLVGFTEIRIGEVLTKKHRPTEALDVLRKALSTLQDLAKTAPNSDYISHNFGNVYVELGDAHAALASDAKIPAARRHEHWREACSWYQKSTDTRRDLEHRGELTSSDTEELNQVAQQVAKCSKAPALGARHSAQQ